MKGLKEDVEVLKEDVKGLKEDVEVLKEDVKGLKEDVEVLKEDVKGLKEDVEVLKEDVKGLKEDVEVLKEDVKGSEGGRGSSEGRCLRSENKSEKIELTQETQILPQLNTIQACYTSTYERYKVSVDDYETMKQDISVLKNVVEQHSEKLQLLGIRNEQEGDDFYCITAMMNSDNDIVVWYIDMIASQGLDTDGILYFDDLYLDLVVYPNGEIMVDDLMSWRRRCASQT